MSHFSTRFLNISGKRFGNLVDKVPIKRGRRIRWLCECDCGGTKETDGGTLRSGRCTHCGCLKSENIAKINRTHGLSKCPEFHSWWGMIERCENPKHHKYARYGGRGIKVCERWRGPNGLAHFIVDLGPRPKGSTIERIDNDGNYEPDNCRWATKKEQSRNKSSNRIFTIDGVSKPLIEWCEQYGIKHPQSVTSRISRGIPFHIALTTPFPKRKRRSDARN